MTQPGIMLWNHLRIALRTLKRHSANNFISVAGLAVGMASCMLLVLYVADELRYDRFHQHADRVFRVATDVLYNDEATERSAYSFMALGPTVVDNIPNVETATRVGISWAASFIKVDDRQFDGERILVADSSFFDLFTYQFVEGTPASALNRPYTIVLTRSTARRYFGDKNPIGRTVNWENDLDFEVTAVVEDPPSNTHIRFDALATTQTLNAMRPGRLDTDWRILYGYTYIKLSDAAHVEKVEAGLPTLVAPYLQSTQERWGSSFQFKLQPVSDIHLRSSRDNEIEPGGSIARIYLLAGIAGLMLLIACINVVSLSTARGAERAREIGVRKVMGASRTQLVRQYLSESAVLSLLAFMLSIMLFALFLPSFNLLSGKAFGADVLLSPVLMLGFISVACAVGLFGGGYTAFVLSALRPVSALKGRARQPRGQGLVRKSLVVAQFGAVVALLFGALVIQQQLNYMKHAELGFEKSQLIVLGEIFAGSPVSRWNEMRMIKQELLRNPRVDGVTLASEWPTRPVQGQIVIRPDAAPEGEGIQMAWYQIEEDYLDVLGMELLYGRAFNQGFASDSAAVLINQEAARRLGIREHEAVGTIIFGPENNEVLGTVIGIVKDFHTQSLQQAVEPIVFFYYWARPRNILVKVDGQDVPGALAQVEETWTRFMPEKPLRYEFLDQEYAALYQSEMRLSRLAGVFTGLAILIACMGLWSLASFSTVQRTKEIGLRKVLGASVSGIVALLTKDFLRLIGFAFVLSAPVAYLVMHRWLEGYAYRIELSIWMVLVVGVAVLGITLITVSYQSIKASLADPIQSIRSE